MVTPSVTAPGDTNPSDATETLFARCYLFIFQTIIIVRMLIFLDYTVSFS